MNKKLTRLTALLLAVLMMMSTFSTALADTTLTKDQYTQSLQQMQEDMSLIPTQLETPNVYTTTVNTTTLVPTYAAGEGEVSPAKSITVTAKTAQEDVGGYQWQIYVDGVWANIQGETAQTLELTYAMAKQAMDADNNVQLRCKLFPAVSTFALTEDEAVYEDEITVKVNETVTYTEQTGTTEITVTQYNENEEPDEDYYAAWELQNAAKGSSVSTFALTPAADTSEETTPEMTKLSVVIYYQFEDGKMAANSRTFELLKGSPLKVSVKNPLVPGYLPYDANGNQCESVELNFESLQKDETCTITYLPTEVPFKVKHYWQKVDAETADKNEQNYELVDTQTIYANGDPLMALTGSTVPKGLERDYEGFRALLYKQDAIAADGSTEVEIYYNRDYYLMNFKLHGGYGVDPIYARYEATIGDGKGSVGTPKREGYEFLGWSTTSLEKYKDDGSIDSIMSGVGTEADADATIPRTMPAENTTYYAVWKMNDTAKVTVVLWGENPNDEEYSYLATGELMLPSNSSYKYNGTDKLYLLCDLEEHNHATSGCELTCGKEEHTQHTEECVGNCTHSEHKLECFSVRYGELEVTTKPDDLNVSPVSGEVYEHKVGNGDVTNIYYYLYLDGKWYRSKETTQWILFVPITYQAGIQEINLSCNHNHADACYSCEVHEHIDSCYGCGKAEHTHNSNCNQEVEGLDSTLWTFVSSETVTVNPDGSTIINVKYDRVSYSVQFYSDAGCTKEYSSLRITAKWGESILAKWPTYNGSSSWYVPNKNNTWQNSIQIMPVGGAKFYGPKTGSASYTAYYYTEALPGDTADTIVYHEVTYKLHHTDTSSSSGNVTDEERYAIEGFTYKEGTKNGTSYNNATFYYTRNRYAIEFYSPITLLKKQEGIYFEENLSKYNWTPDASMAPAQYEAGSVRFEGWYLNPECTGDRYDFAAHTMPAAPNNGDTALVFYAKWVPVTRTVTFYIDKATLDNNGAPLGQRQTPHGSLLSNPVGTPENGDYEFVGWFYVNDDGQEKRFDFQQMIITQDMNVYAKWLSNTMKEYTIYYKLLDENGKETDIELAAPTTDSELAGMMVTVNAKTGDQLYAQYQNSGYFPVVPSHSITINIEGNEENKLNEYTFWYVQRANVPYIVQYVTDKQNENGSLTEIEIFDENSKTYKTYYVVAEEKVVSKNTKAIVDEQFKTVSGYMPDAFSKRLILNGSTELTKEELEAGKAWIDRGIVDEEDKQILVHPDNVLVFFYHVDTEHAYYKISHWTENVAKDSEGNSVWTLYTDSGDQIGDIDEVYYADGNQMTISGFDYSYVEYVVNDIVVATYTKDEVDAGLALSADGMEIKLYYTRNSYPYQVRYLERGTGEQGADKVLHAPKDGSGLYTETITEDAIPITNYTLVSANQQNLRIQVEDPADVAKNNIITFYYQENYSTLNYGIVDPNGKVHYTDAACGTLERYSETILVVTGEASGSTAAVSGSAYKFVGWYSDPSCEEKYLLTKNAEWKPTKGEKDAWTDGTTYYAKFEYNLTDLTVEKAFDDKNGALHDENASFLFEVKQGNTLIARFMLNAGESVTIKGLTVGQTYTVTEITDWSSRYTASYSHPDGAITLKPNGNTVTVTNSRNQNDKWLDSEAYSENQVGKQSTTN